MKSELTSAFWSERYKGGDTGWDIGEPSAPLKAYIDGLSYKLHSILIPGGGNGYEAEYLFKNGFKNVHLLDWSQEPLQRFKERVKNFPENNLILSDFFNHAGKYDLILEQTFFCAIDPAFRPQYAEHVHTLLNPKGKLAGLLFNDPLNSDHPPFGGNKKEYLTYFEPYFEINTFESCYNSIEPRAGREFFIILTKKEL